MADRSKAPPDAPKKPASTEKPDWEKALYSEERIGQWIRGEISLQELSAFKPEEMVEIASMGYSMFEMGKFKEARTIFSGLAAMDPKEAYYRTALGCIYMAEENFDRAEALFNEAIALNPKELAAFVNRGEVNLRKGKVLEAAQDFKQAVDLDPKNENPLSMRARALAAATLETLQQMQSEGLIPKEGPEKTPGPSRKTTSGEVPKASVPKKK